MPFNPLLILDILDILDTTSIGAASDASKVQQRSVGTLGILDRGSIRVMQPPHVHSPWLSDGLQQIKAEAEARAEATNRAGTPGHAAGIVDDYTARIETWVAGMTPHQRRRRFTLQEVMTLAGLQGRFRPRASVHCTGLALRQCGFKSCRDWTAAGRNQRYWLYVEEQ